MRVRRWRSSTWPRNGLLLPPLWRIRWRAKIGVGTDKETLIDMKHITGIIAAALLLAGCVQQMENPEENESPVFTASFENAATKTYLDSGHNLLWTADDRLSIFINTYNQQYKFMGETGDNNGDFEAVLVSGLHRGDYLSTNYAVYPYKSDTEVTNDGTITCTLPAVQAYAENSFGLGANTMVAVTSSHDDHFLPFRNLCGYLVIKLYGEGTVKRISLKGNNGEKISGAATITASYGNEPNVSMTDAATEEITLDCGSGVVLGSTSQTATEFWLCIPPVTFNDGFTVTITGTDYSTVEKSVSSSRTITRNVINTLSALNVEFSSDTPVPEIVDLGLPSGLKWASFNLGASKPEECGGYYQWAGLEDLFDTSIYPYWDNCPYHSGLDPFTGWMKYIPIADSSYWSGTGSPDNKTVLDLEDDVAHVRLGGKWRLPTGNDYVELFDNCTSEWTILNGVNGRKFTSKNNGNSIFLPAAGYFNFFVFMGGSEGIYWSSSLYSGATGVAHAALTLEFDSDGTYFVIYPRYSGYSVRPVSE